MSNPAMTFGEYLRCILKKKNMTIASLAAQTDTKSRNTIQRLVKDECSLEIILKFKKKLLLLDPLNLTPAEHIQLEESIEVSRVGKETMLSRKAMLDLFKKNKTITTLKSKQRFGLESDSPISLNDLFQSYSSFQSVNILAFNAAFLELTDAFIELIHAAPESQVLIEQLIYMGKNPTENTDTFISIYKLLNYRNYRAYHNSSPELNGLSKNSFSILSDFVVVFKTSKEGAVSTDLIKFNEKRDFSLLTLHDGDTVFEFYLSCFEEIKSNCTSIRKFHNQTEALDRLLEICDYLMYLEKSAPEFLIKQNMCFQMVNPDILYKMLEDSGFMGFSPSHPQIQKLIKLSIERFNKYYSINKMKTHLFTKQGLKDFVSTGLLSDHLFCFRPFTKVEVKETLEFMLKQIEENKFFRFYLLQEDVLIGNIEYIYFEGSVLYLIDSTTGYGNSFKEGIITSKPIIEIFDDFIRNELIKHHTLSDAETVSFLKKLIGSI